MIFTSPLWLLGLLPWAALALWLIWGRRRRKRVPFVKLWQTDEKPPRARRAIEVPPIGLAMLLAAMLLALLASAGPRWPVSSRPALDQPIEIIVDRGLTMSAGEKAPQFQELAEALNGELQRRWSIGNVTLRSVPETGEDVTDLHDWLKHVGRLPITALDTTTAVVAAARTSLLRFPGPVIVISDAPLGIDNPRLVQVSPTSPLETVAIERLSAGRENLPELMVRLRNQSPLTSATIRISSNGASIDHDVLLPPIGQTADYFFDTPAHGSMIEAQVFPASAVPAVQSAWLVRAPVAPIEAHGAIPPELSRLIVAYLKTHPPADGAASVVVTADPGALPTDSPGVIWQPNGSVPVDGIPLVVAHEVTKAVDWPEVLQGASVARPAPDGWQPIVRNGASGDVAVAIRQSPARQVWVGISSPDWSHSAEFVKFWQNVFDWVEHANAGYASLQLSDVAPDAKPGPSTHPARADPTVWPGVFDLNGERRAFNASLPTGPRVIAGEWQAALQRIAGGRSGGTIALAPTCLIAAMACIALGAIFWKRVDV